MLYGESLSKGRPLDKEIYPVSFKYLHGNIESLNGYDLVYSDNKEEAQRINTQELNEDIEIILEGADGPNNKITARIYTWLNEGVDHFTRGLIVLKDDIKANEYAKMCQDEKKYLI